MFCIFLWISKDKEKDFHCKIEGSRNYLHITCASSNTSIRGYGDILASWILKLMDDRSQMALISQRMANGVQDEENNKLSVIPAK